MPADASLLAKIALSLLSIAYILVTSVLHYPITVSNCIADALDYIWNGNIPEGIK